MNSGRPCSYLYLLTDRMMYVLSYNYMINLSQIRETITLGGTWERETLHAAPLTLLSPPAPSHLPKLLLSYKSYKSWGRGVKDHCSVKSCALICQDILNIPYIDMVCLQRCLKEKWKTKLSQREKH